MASTKRPSSIPPFSSLPLNKGDPLWSAWGLYGKDDELGMLNRLTDEVVKEAAKEEIRTGVRINLDWPLDAQNDVPLFARKAFHKDIIWKKPRTVNDDIWTFNSQSSSQWDGLRHFAYQKEQKFYNGVTMEDIHGDGCKNTINGIQAWTEKGIVGRGILLDFHRWRLAKGMDYEPFKTGSIKLKDLKAVAESQGTEIKFGDILIIRSGYMAAHNKLSKEDILAITAVNPPGLSGVEQSEEVLEWIWDHFSAVAGDHPPFECWPSQKPYLMHEILLSGWGCPIGELFDLEKLAEHCEKENRYSFFVTSKVNNVPGGVASPPNILAIF